MAARRSMGGIGLPEGRVSGSTFRPELSGARNPPFTRRGACGRGIGHFDEISIQACIADGKSLERVPRPPGSTPINQRVLHLLTLI
jgi:hypothetical protein